MCMLIFSVSEGGVKLCCHMLCTLGQLQVRVCCKGVHHNRNLRVGAPHWTTGPLKCDCTCSLLHFTFAGSDILKLWRQNQRLQQFQAYRLHQHYKTLQIRLDGCLDFPSTQINSSLHGIEFSDWHQLTFEFRLMLGPCPKQQRLGHPVGNMYSKV